MNIVETQPFQLFPVNKSNANTYSYYASSPLLEFEFNQNGKRMIDPKSLKLMFKFRLKANTDGDRFPSNVYDVDDTATDRENLIAYIDDRVSVSSIFQNVTISNMRGNIYEQCRDYNRNLASQIGVTASYKDLCSVYEMNFASYSNNDMIARAISGKIPVALSLRTGFLQNNAPLSLVNGGLKLSLNLAPDSQVIYGTNGNRFVYEISQVSLIGRYMVLEQELMPQKGIMEYHAYFNYLNVMNANNDHSNINLNLNQVVGIYQNFIPSTWTNNFAYNGFSTPPILNSGGAGGFTKALFIRQNFNRGAVRFPITYPIDEEKANTDGSYQALRSRLFLNSIFPYAELNATSISDVTEDVGSMVQKRPDNEALKTPQSADGGFVKAWERTAGGGAKPTRTGDFEKAADVFGTGVRMDDLGIDESLDYSAASFNYNIESQLDNTTNNTYTMVLAKVRVMTDGQGNLVAAN